MLNTATSYLALLQDDEVQIKSIALDKLNLLVDEHWSEISDYIKTLKTYYENKAIPDKQQVLALILSKIYYNLEDYDSAIEWALESGEKFNINEQSLYISTILKKILDKYIGIRKKNFYKKNEQEPTKIDSRIQAIVDNVFNNCIKKKFIAQAIGFSIESFDLDRLVQSIEATNLIQGNLQLLYDLIQDFVVNTEYKNAIVNVILKLYIKHAGNQYFDITKCQFLLNNSEALSSTLINILMTEPNPTIAYQIAFDLVENQNPSYLRIISEQIKKINEEKKVDENKINQLLKILSGEISRSLILTTLSHRNQLNDKLLKGLVDSTAKAGSVVHLGIIFLNSLLNSHTGNDKFLKENLNWVSKASNWARFCTTASLGAIHMGNVEKGHDIMKPYLPGTTNMPSVYAQGGAFYGLGLIYANTNDPNILKILLDALNKPSNNKETIQHGIFLALGLVAMGSHNVTYYERIRDGIYADDAIIGEAAGYAIGLIMAGSKNAQAIDDLIKYAHDTQHEKIIRAIAMALALIVYGAEEEADTLIEQLGREKDPILRYGAMYCIGMAYAGTGNTAMLQKLIKISVSDVNDDVRRAAMINIGFLQIRNPDVLFDELKVISLLSESYNTNVRFGAIMAIGIAYAGSGKINPYKVIQPLFTDPSYLVRQACFIATGMIFSQTTITQEPKLDSFKEELKGVLNDKDEHVLIRLGALVGQGLMELGGRNCTINLVNPYGTNKMSSIIGLALFTQYYYWFPMLHFINLAVNPSMLIGVDENLKIVRGYKIISKAKPSLFAYPSESIIQEKTKAVKQEAAVLSTHSRVKAKERKTGTVTLTEIKNDGNLSAKPSVELKSGPSGVIPSEEKKEEQKEGKKEEKKEEEPSEEILNNPFRIIPRQKGVIYEIDGQDFIPVVKGRINGFLLLNKAHPQITVEYEDFKKVEVKKEDKKEEKKDDKKDYKPVPTEDVDMPEDIDISKV